MCGIAGFLEWRRDRPAAELQCTATAMAVTMRHRGPDDAGAWADARFGIAIGHRRLSVLDLSPHGHQPMTSAGLRYVLTYNGEIYNFSELRHRLSSEGHRFVGRSDTEVVLAAVESWGLDRALRSMNGMFAFALWDRELRELHLARDRLGEKPLYYGWAGDTFLFGSELKALRAHPDFRPTIDRGALALYLRHNCVPAPHSVYAGVSKLLPGTTVVVGADAGPANTPRPRPYWSALEVAEAGVDSPLASPAEELTDELEHLLMSAVGMRMQADVPLGAFLSGGIDSSVVVALMQAQSTRRVKTFTIGFDNTSYNEAGDAAGVARHLGTDHVELKVSPRDAMAVIPRLPTLYDEPFGDSSQIPTLIVSELARRDVTVALSGDGGDELFAGYNRYSWAERIWNRIRYLPRPLRRAGAAALGRPSPQTWDSIFRRSAAVLPSRLDVRTPGVKIQKLASAVRARNIDDLYLDLVSHWKDPAVPLPGAVESPSRLGDPAHRLGLTHPVERMMYLDLVTYLPDDILTKVDRASMGVSLEARVPMLDPRVVEFAWRVPLSLKVRDGQGKWLLRQVLHRHVPAELVDRPKMGFGLPLGQWLRGPLRAWAEELLAERRLGDEGFFDAAVVRGVWHEHLSGGRDRQDQLWDVLMFQAWLEETSVDTAPAR